MIKKYPKKKKTTLASLHLDNGRKKRSLEARLNGRKKGKHITPKERYHTLKNWRKEWFIS